MTAAASRDELDQATPVLSYIFCTAAAADPHSRAACPSSFAVHEGTSATDLQAAGWHWCEKTKLRPYMLKWVCPRHPEHVCVKPPESMVWTGSNFAEFIQWVRNWSGRLREIVPPRDDDSRRSILIIDERSGIFRAQAGERITAPTPEKDYWQAATVIDAEQFADRMRAGVEQIMEQDRAAAANDPENVRGLQHLAAMWPNMLAEASRLEGAPAAVPPGARFEPGFSLDGTIAEISIVDARPIAQIEAGRTLQSEGVDDYAYPKVPSLLRPLLDGVLQALNDELRVPGHRAGRSEALLRKQIRNLFERTATQDPASPPCVSCGTPTRLGWRDYQDQWLCWPCADGTSSNGEGAGDE